MTTDQPTAARARAPHLADRAAPAAARVAAPARVLDLLRAGSLAGGRPGRSIGHRLTLAACAASLLAAAAAAAAERPEPATTLGEVLVKGQRLREQPTAHTRFELDAHDIRDAGLVHTQDLLRRVPGLEIRNLHLGGVADSISLRGFSSGSHGGDLGVLLDGIPLNEAISHADGYADFNVVIPLELARVDVYKGPTSALYGNYNRAGTVFLDTRKGGDYVLADFAGGSDRTFDAQLAAGAAIDGPGSRHTLNGALQLYRTDGWRPQSGYERGTAALRWGVALGPRTELALAGRAHRGEWDSASYVTVAQFDAGDRFGVDPRVQNDGGDKRFHTGRAELLRTVGERTRLIAFAYGTRQDFTRFFTRPVNATAWRQREEAYDRDVHGLGVSLNGAAGAALHWTAGVETYSESTAFDFHDGLDRRRRVAPAIYDRTYRFETHAAFAEAGVPLGERVDLTLGLRFDRFDGRCRRDGPETGPDPCDRAMNEYERASPKAGLRARLGGGFALRAGYGSGFQLPNPRGLFSAGARDVDPNVFRQYELGLGWSGGALTLDLVGFRLDSVDEIRELPAGSGQWFNAGTTRREGVELALDWRAGDWRATLAAAALDTAIRRNPDPALIGRALPAVPDSTVDLRLAFDPARGIGGTLALRRVGEYPIDPANTLRYYGYTTLEAGLGWRGDVVGRPQRLTLTAENVLDEAYATSASLIGGVRLYAPGAPRRYMLRWQGGL